MGAELTTYTDYQQILTHRVMMLNTYYCHPSNVRQNQRQLALLSRLIRQRNLPPSLFCSQSVDDLLSSVQSQQLFNHSQIYDVLPLILSQSEIDVHAFVRSAYTIPELQPLAFYLIYYFELEFEHFQHLSISDEHIQSYLMALYFSGSFTLLMRFCDLKQSKMPLSLYADVCQNDKSALLLLDRFEEYKLLDSTLFILFVLAQDEMTLTSIINKISLNEQHQVLMIKLMGASGYSKFIPFLAQALFKDELVSAAYDALKMQLGDLLDAFIPLSFQSESDEKKRCSSLQYYGAKLLHAWQQRQPDEFAPKMFAGLPYCTQNLHTTIQHSSDRHGKWAALHLLATGSASRLLLPHHYWSLV